MEAAYAMMAPSDAQQHWTERLGAVHPPRLTGWAALREAPAGVT